MIKSVIYNKVLSVKKIYVPNNAASNYKKKTINTKRNRNATGANRFKSPLCLPTPINHINTMTKDGGGT